MHALRRPPWRKMMFWSNSIRKRAQAEVGRELSDRDPTIRAHCRASANDGGSPCQSWQLVLCSGSSRQGCRAFKKAIRLKPSLAAPHFFLGVLSFNARDFEHALSYLKEAEKLEPANTLAPLYIGYTFYVQKRYQEAAEVLDRVIENDAKNLDAWYHLSKLHGQLSKSYFEKLQTGSPNSFFTALARSHFFESGANWEQASQELSKAVEIDKSRPELKKRLEWLTRR